MEVEKWKSIKLVKWKLYLNSNAKKSNFSVLDGPAADKAPLLIAILQLAVTDG